MAEPELRDSISNYPSVELAYDFAVQSYDIALNRYDAWDARIQNLLSLGVTLTLAIPFGGSALGYGFRSIWFVLAMTTFAAGLALGIYGRLVGVLKIVDPEQLYNKMLGLSMWEFKKDFIFWAGKNYQSNRALIDQKARIALVIASLFFLEGLWVALWVSFHP